MKSYSPESNKVEEPFDPSSPMKLMSKNSLVEMEMLE
jgi:hypothetical protein